MLTYRIGETDHCRQVDSFLRNLLPFAPTGYIHKTIRSGHILVDGVKASPETLLLAGDIVTVKESGRTLELLASERPAIDVLWEDDRILVVNKRPGLPMHRTAELEGDLVEEASAFMERRGTPCRLRPVNRLDRVTSGVVILAKSSGAAGMFGRVVKEEGLGKLYLAAVEGSPDEELTVTEPLDEKEAETRFRLLCRRPGGALLAAYPVTGRMHQIRRHLSIAGYPVIGDKRYGAVPRGDLTGIALHSFRTETVHPESGRKLILFAPLPAELLGLLHGVCDDILSSIMKALPAVP